MDERILVVDDEEFERDLVAEALGMAGYDVTTAGDGAEALAHLEAADAPFDLIISDIDMPRMDGLEFIRRCRTSHPDAPVLVMTAVGDKDLIVSILRYGVCEYIDKPFGIQEMRDMVRRLLSAQYDGGPAGELRRLRREIDRLVDERTDSQRAEMAKWIRGGVRHRFNQPLTVLMANLGLVRKASLPENAETHLAAQLPELLRDMQSAAECLAGLVELFSRLETIRSREYVGETRILDLERSAGAPH